MGRLSGSLCREAILQVPAAADGSATAAGGADALQLAAPRLPSINTGRVCGRADSARQLQLASAHSRAALVAAVQRHGELKQPDIMEASKAAESLPQEQWHPGDGGSTDGSGSGNGSLSARSGHGQGPTCRNTIHLVANAQSVRGLHIRTSSSSEVPQEQQPRQRPAGDAPAAAPKQASPRGCGGGIGSKAGRLRTGLRRAVTFPAILLDRTSDRAASTAGGAAAPAAAVVAAAGALARKEQEFAIEPRHQRTFTLMDWAEERPWGEAATAQGIAAGMPAAAASAEGSPQPTPSPLPSSRLRQRTPPSAGASGRMLLPGPFIHLIGKLARLRLWKRLLVLHCSACLGSVCCPAWRPCQTSNQPCNHAHAAFAGPSRQQSLQAGTTASPSPDGSGASTPQQRSPLRGGSPERQQQMQNFQRYLQQQLAAQQRGRYGPSTAGEGSGGGSHSGTASGAGSPYSSPLQRGSPGGTPSPPRRRDGTPSPTSGALPPAHRTPSPSRLSRVAAQQQQFTARLHSAGSGAADAAAQHAQQAVQHAQQGQQGQHTQQADLQGAPSWGKAEADAGSDPHSISLASLAGHSQGHSLASLAGHCQGHSLTSHSVGGSGQLAHAESAGFSSWGLPSPSTGKRGAQPCCSCCLGHASAQLSEAFSHLAGVGSQLPRTVHRPEPLVLNSHVCLQPRRPRHSTA